MQSTHFPPEKIRNIGIIAHIDAGKTTTTERILFYTGITHKIGSVDDGTTTTDWMEQERERGITIVSAAITACWKDHQINIIDTPGHIDFTAEVQRALRVLDGGVVVFDGVHGVESQSETVWRQADKYKVPRLCFINKMDRVGANYEHAMLSIRQRLHAPLALLQLPLGEEQHFKGIIDLLTMQATVWHDDSGSDPVTGAIPDAYLSAAQQARETLLETLAETDDVLLERFLEDDADDEITVAQWMSALRKATLENRLFPVLFGASLRNTAVQPLLDAIIDYLPSPVDIEAVKGINPDTQQPEQRLLTADQPLAALVFKIVSDPYAGRIAYVRVYSGELKNSATVLNAGRGKKQRIGRLVRVFADHREDIDKVPAGEIDAILSMKDIYTGDTLCDPNHPILLENIQFPLPVISIAIEPENNKDKDELAKALSQLAEEDPTFKVHTDKDSGQTILSGMGELHLEILVDRIKLEHQLGIRTGKPEVNYKETLARELDSVEGRYIHQSGGRGQYGHVVMSAKPAEPGSGLHFINKIKGGVIPSEYIPAVKKGLKEAASFGVHHGLEITDIEFTLLDGSYHNVDSSELAFKNAAVIAFKNTFIEAGSTLLEPVCKLEVVTPAEYLGDVLGQLNSKRCEIDGTELMLDGTQTIHGFVPLSEMFGYATSLRSITKGRAMFSMEFDHYAAVPKRMMSKVMPHVHQHQTPSSSVRH
ncbi:MAG: elongation factor G [Pseudomonadales bacterium]|nr:elongation factor G [Pseudomonadales bacterium]